MRARFALAIAFGLVALAVDGTMQFLSRERAATSAASTSVSAASTDVVTPVTSVLIKIGRSEGRATALIRNPSTRTLEAVRFSLEMFGRSETFAEDYCCQLTPRSVATARGIGPRQSRTTMLGVTMTALGLTATRATVTLAVFTDGTYEGSRALKIALDRERADKAAAAAYWVEHLDAVAAMTPADARTYLLARIDDVERTARASHAVPELFAVPSLLGEALRAPDRFARAVSDRQRRLQWLQQAYLDRVPR